MYEDLEGFELSFSVQIDGNRVLELHVDECETGDSVWQTTNSSGQILDRSERYEDQARCLRDGLNKVLPQ